MITEMTNTRFLACIGILLALAILLGGCVGSPEEQKFAELTRKAEAGDAEAQFDLAGMYYDGKGVPKDMTKVVEWLHKAALQGHIKAQLALGYMYREGKGAPKDGATAVRWLQMAAAAGNVEAEYYLGLMYDEGDGVTKDLTKAAEWYQKAATHGNPQAQNRLGLMHYSGEGVTKDRAQAVEWYQKAAAQGNTDAQIFLAFAYESGEGISKDLAKSLEWWQKAATQGNPHAQMRLGWMYANGRGALKDEARAAEWYQKAAAQGEAYAQVSLGLMYETGTGVPKDRAKAVEWFQRAAVQGDAAAQFRLGLVYGLGEGVGQDIVLAYAWLNLATANGNRKAKGLRNRLTLTQVQRSEAERLSSNWKKGQILVREGGAAGDRGSASGGALSKIGTGTAFIVNMSGQAITNYHVVGICREVRAEGREGVVKIVTTDAVNDIALVQIPGTINATTAISSDPAKVRQGEEIVVFGFPLNAMLSSGGNLTPGVVSALSGLGNNTNQIQITASIQPGSSGSPVLNKKGEVVGMVSMKLSDIKMMKATGQVGQNVNFAVSGQTLKTFLDTHKVDYRTIWLLSFDKSNADLADEARKWTLVVECWK